MSPIGIITVKIVGDAGLTVESLEERYGVVGSRLTLGGQTVVAHAAKPLASGYLITVTAREAVHGRLTSGLGRLAPASPR